MKNKKQIKRADVFFARMLKDPVIRINYAEERTKSSDLPPSIGPIFRSGNRQAHSQL